MSMGDRSPTTKPLRFLVADDDQDDWEFISNALLVIGASTVSFVRDGQELREYLRRQGVNDGRTERESPDVVILDLKMPKRGGLEVLAEVKQGLQDFVKPTADFFRTYGTTGITSRSAHSGDSPVKNWGGVGIVDFPEVSTLTGDVVNAKMEKHYACWHCPLACGAESKESENAEYPYPRHTHRPEYETMASFGTMNLNNNLDSLTYANHLCNAYGFDSISAGATVSFAIECFENGILTKEDTDGLELHWRDDKAVIKLLELMGTRQGMDLGYTYESDRIVPDGTDLPAVDDPMVDYVPNAPPGSPITVSSCPSPPLTRSQSSRSCASSRSRPMSGVARWMVSQRSPTCSAIPSAGYPGTGWLMPLRVRSRSSPYSMRRRAQT